MSSVNRGLDYKVTMGLFLSTATALFPFAVFHGLNGKWAMAGGLGLLVALLIAGSVRVWRNRNTLYVSLALTLAATLMTWWALIDVGPVIINWAYPLILLYFYLLPNRTAVITTVIGIPVSIVLVSLSVETAVLTRIIAGLTLVTFFAYVFSRNVARQQEELTVLANFDSLTKIGNRRYLTEALDEAPHRLKRFDVPTSLIIIDLDHFKLVNDTHGHSVGDRVLVEVVNILRQRIRATDALFRYGGEEFVVLAGHSNLMAAHQLAQDLVQAVAAFPIESIGQAATISAGVAELMPGETWETWLQRGDRALYMAKEGGRNRVIALPSSVAEETSAQLV